MHKIVLVNLTHVEFTITLNLVFVLIFAIKSYVSRFSDPIRIDSCETAFVSDACAICVAESYDRTQLTSAD